jgi:hypothetical protein
MMTNPSIFRRAYDGLALFAMLNLVVVGGLGAYLIGSGVADTEKIRRVAAVLRGEDESDVDAETPPAPAEAVVPVAADDSVAMSQMDLEIMRREAERIKAELDQRLALNNGIMLKVMTEREAFRKERDAEAKRKEIASQEQNREGFAKQIEIYEGLMPKVAVEHLLSLPEADEAARILLEMDTRKAKKIVEAAKRPEHMQQMKVILQRLREVAPDRSSELGTGE